MTEERERRLLGILILLFVVEGPPAERHPLRCEMLCHVQPVVSECE